MAIGSSLVSSLPAASTLAVRAAPKERLAASPAEPRTPVQPAFLKPGPLAQRQNAFAALTANLPQDLVSALSEERQKSQEAINSLEQTKRSITSDRKGQAQERLDRARQKLATLKMLGGDPKALAQQAKEIAEEIRSAAKDYGAALKSEGGSASAASMAGAATPTVSADTDAGAEPGVEPPSGASPLGASQPAAAGDAASGPEAPTDNASPRLEEANTTGDQDSAAQPTAKAPSSGEAQEATPGLSSTPAPSRSEDAQRPSSEELRKTAVDAYRNTIAEATARANKAKGEREILQQFKDAAREARRVIEEAARRLKVEQAGDKDATDALKSIAATDKEIEGLQSVMLDQQVAITAPSITEGALVAPISSPALSILA